MSVKSRLKTVAQQVLPPALWELRQKSRRRRVMQSAGATEETARFILPERSLEQIFPGIQSLPVTSFVSQTRLQNIYAMPLGEMLTLAAIARYTKPRRVFEFGTFSGSTTLALAANAPDDAEVWTMDLEDSPEVGPFIRDSPLPFKIHQIFGNSLQFDYSPFLGQMDLILVDADHSYGSVKSDSENAFRLLRPGGVIVWDDYRWTVEATCAGVTRSLNEISRTRPIVQIAGTRLALFEEGRPST